MELPPALRDPCGVEERCHLWWQIMWSTSFFFSPPPQGRPKTPWKACAQTVRSVVSINVFPCPFSQSSASVCPPGCSPTAVSLRPWHLADPSVHYAVDDELCQAVLSLALWWPFNVSVSSDHLCTRKFSNQNDQSDHLFLPSCTENLSESTPLSPIKKTEKSLILVHILSLEKSFVFNRSFQKQ